MFFLDFYLHRFHHHEKLRNRFLHSLHTIVHHEVLLTWWWWLENSVNRYLIWKINSHLIQEIVVPRYSEHMLTSWAILLHLLGEVLVRGIIPLDTSMSLKYQFQLFGTSHMLRDVQNIFEVPVLSRKAWHTKLSSSHHTDLAKTFTTSTSAPAIGLSPNGASRT